MAQIRAAGEPVTCAELAAYAVAPPEALEAGKAYQKAFDAMPEEKENAEDTAFDKAMAAKPPHGRYPDALLGLLREELGKESECLRLLHEAVQGPAARFYVDWEQGPYAATPHLAGVRHIVRLFEREATLAAHDGDSVKAVRNIAEIFTIADTIREEPGTISQLAGATCRLMAAKGVNRIVEVAAFSDTQLAALGQKFQAGEVTDSCRLALISDRAVSLYGYSSPVLFRALED